MMVNSCMQKWQWFDGDRMYEKWRCLCWWYVVWTYALLSHMFMHSQVEYLYPTTVIRILCIQRQWLGYFVFNDGDYDTVVSSEGDWYHMHIKSGLGALHTLMDLLNVTYFIMCLVNLGDLCALVNLVNYVLDEIWWICEDLKVYLYDYYACMLGV